MSKLKHFLEQSWLLVVSSFFFGLLIAVTNAALSPIIEQQKINKLNALAGAMLPAAENFVPLEEPIEMSTARGKTRPVPVYRAQDANDKCVGWTFNATGSGFSGPIELVVCVDAAFEKIAGFDVLVSTETVGYGDRMKEDEFRDQFKGAPAGKLTLSTTGERKDKEPDAEIIAISGATISSEAAVDAINDAVTQIKAALQKKGLIEDGK